ncbi:hypothetical protein FUT69_08930 [Xylella taiwanensis]|uniref:Uncharacterized protein n=1 Tax=Xylella taiwanensis TaxID=1444770 RepID=Z9JGS2_9GAMM|nr:hypothetical protein [Xylella taiwanensis]AXI82852.1 hypothetical protein AB672_02195 [Xylella taiwanensis]EWS77570.1 hypothetical protein AF72_10180 [Xylella taiwanensis]MCD8460404.1 hypothetical protein [Xylella taiwanensis]MCD8464906.1 hypothetical protein [Xylella taiwanensis]MCD8467532.1 hypothetical protein [Xylella taiwanensis]
MAESVVCGLQNSGKPRPALVICKTDNLQHVVKLDKRSLDVRRLCAPWGQMFTYSYVTAAAIVQWFGIKAANVFKACYRVAYVWRMP